MEQMKKQSLKVGTKFYSDLVTNVDFSCKPFVASTDSG